MHMLTNMRHVVQRRRTYVRARELYAADHDDHEKMNAWVLQVWGSPSRPSLPRAPLLNSELGPVHLLQEIAGYNTNTT